MLNKLFLICIFAILVIFTWNHCQSKNNLSFLTKYGADPSLFNIINSLNLPDITVETSIKINLITGKINHHRYTVPIAYKDFTDDTLSYILDKLGKLELYSKITKFIKTKTTLDIDMPDPDVIFGLDTELDIFKIYFDTSNGELFCLECFSDGSSNQKHYEYVNKQYALKYAYMLHDTPANYDNWNFVLSKQDDKISDSVTGYHIYLKQTVNAGKIYSKLDKKFYNDPVYWVSVANNELTLYTRQIT